MVRAVHVDRETVHSAVFIRQTMMEIMSNETDSRMQPIEIQTALTVGDWRAYQATWCNEANVRRLPVWQSVLQWLVIAFVVSWLLQSSGSAWLPFAAGVALVIGSYWLHTRRLRKLSEPDADGAVLGPCTLRFDVDGVHVSKPCARASYAWGSIQRISATPEHLFLWIDRLAAIIVPLRDVSPEMKAELPTVLQQKVGTAGTIEIPAIPRAPEPAARATSLREFATAMGRLLTARLPVSSAFNMSDGKLAALIVFYIGGWLLIDRVRSGSAPTFDIDGILALAWHALVIVLIAAVLARAAEPRVAFRHTLALTLALLPLYLLGQWAAAELPGWAVSIGLVLVLYVHHCLQRGLQAITGRWQVRAGSWSFLLMIAVLWVNAQTYTQPEFWYASEADEDIASWREQWADTEALLYRQSSQIDAAVARLERPRELEAAGFFLGFAGVGEQSVFASEIALAQQRIAQHFPTDSRSLQLVNDRRDTRTRPLASPSGLERALTGLAAKMDLEHDVLFLALSSHGSRDAQISVSNGILPLSNLSADKLAQALRAAGIRRKVIIVSACYAGTFIAPLKDSNTIIIAAAAADRTSFGCADDRELTYFGEAFYRDALQQTGDLRRAFELAKQQIAQRETTEGKRASNPQAYFGADLEAYLRGWSESKPEPSFATLNPSLAK